MKFKILILFIALKLYTNTIYACCGGDVYFVDAPKSYIELFALNGDRDEDDNMPHTFYLIVDQYHQLPEASEEEDQEKDTNAPDLDARKISEETERDDYESYLKGAEQFQRQNYQEALKTFTDLKNDLSSFKTKVKRLLQNNTYSWVKEASTYMIARSKLVMSQHNWDGYSDPVKQVDQDILQSAKASYELYLEDYPNGLYANSARSINRKIFYLSGNQEKLDEELKNLATTAFINHLNLVGDNDLLNNINEFVRYFKGNVDITKDHPMLIVYKLLDHEYTLNKSQFESLKRRKNDFQIYPGLFDYIYALQLYQTKQYEELLSSIPQADLTNNLMCLSTEILRVHALVNLGRTDEALLSLLKMIKLHHEDRLEIEIANIKLKDNQGLWLYTNDSPVITPKNLEAIAQLKLTDNELELGIKNKQKIAQDKRQFLVDERARRYLFSRRFKDLELLMNQEVGLNWLKPISKAITTLAQFESDPEALVNIGTFIYHNYITPYTYIYNYGELNWKKDDNFIERTSSYVPPINMFLEAINKIQQTKQRNETEAKALHYIVRCTKCFECEDRCTWGMKNIPYYSGKEAFQRLHIYYKKSPWTIQTPYYYD